MSRKNSAEKDGLFTSKNRGEFLPNSFPNFDIYLYGHIDPKDLLNPDNWPELRQAMGGKGLSLAIMTALGIPVPQGYTLPTIQGRLLHDLGYKDLTPDLKKLANQATAQLTNKEGARFGDLANPLAVAARSGAATSMPGAMDSILNIGFTKDTIDTFSQKLGPKEAWECFHIFCFGWAASQLGISKKSLENKIELLLRTKITTGNKTTYQRQEEIDFLESWLKEKYNVTIPQTPEEQLHSSILSIYRSYHHPEAIKYRHRMGIAEDVGTTGVNVLTMVYGNQGEVAGSGVVFSHDPKTGEPGLKIEFANGKVGDAVVAGGGNGFENELVPHLQTQLEQVIEQLVQLGGKPVDVEFVIEDGELYFVQYRNLRLALPGMLKQISDEVVQESQNLTEAEKLLLIRRKFDAHILAGLGCRFVEKEVKESQRNENTDKLPRLIARGQPIGGRAHFGMVAFSLKEAENLLLKNENVVLVLEQLDDASKILGINDKYAAEISVVTLEGSPSSHAAYVLGTENIAGSIGCRNLPMDELQVGTEMSVDGVSGEVHLGKLAVAEFLIEESVRELIELRKKMGVSAWESLVQKFESENKLYELESRIREVINFFIKGGGSKSPKALTQEIINLAFPKQFLTEYHVLSTEDGEYQTGSAQYKEEIAQKVRLGWEQGYDVSVRSAFLFSMDDSGETLGSNPWVIFKPGDEERLQQFLYGELPGWKYGSFAAWKRMETDSIKLTEVLVGYNHAGKLDPELANKHAVGVIDSKVGSKNIIVGSTNLDTAQLRSYEEGHYNPDKNVSYKINFDGNTATVVLGFGKAYINKAAVGRLVRKLVRKNKNVYNHLNSEEKEIKKDLLSRLSIDVFDQFEKIKISKTRLEYELIKMIEEGDVTNSVLRGLIHEKSWNRVVQIVNKLITEYVVAVAPGLAAVENVLSNIAGDFPGVTIEFQTGFENGSLDEGWMAVYGLKGLEEVLLALQEEKV